MESNYNDLKNKAYKEALTFKVSDEDIIYGKLEKLGFPVELAKEVAMNIVLEKNKHKQEDVSDRKKMGIAMFVLWVLISIGAYAVTGSFFDAIIWLIIGVPSTLLVYAMTTSYLK